MIKKIFNDKEGKLKKAWIIFGIIFLSLLITLGINTAQDIDDNVPEIPQETVEPEINDNVPEIPQETVEPDIDENVPEIPQETVEVPEETSSESPEEDLNTTEEVFNETLDEFPEEELNTTEEILNETLDQVEITGESIIEESSDISLQSKPVLDIEIDYPDKITRGEIIEVKALIKNSGAIANNVFAEWSLVEGFEIISGEQIKNCGDLNTNEICTSLVNIQTSDSTSLGINQIKIILRYV